MSQFISRVSSHVFGEYSDHERSVCEFVQKVRSTNQHYNLEFQIQLVNEIHCSEQEMMMSHKGIVLKNASNN